MSIRVVPFIVPEPLKSDLVQTTFHQQRLQWYTLVMFLNSALLRQFIGTFNGYGDYRAKYWLIGMEEGGGGSFDEVTRRLARWDEAGRPELLDLKSHHLDGDLTNFIGDAGGLQKTWSQLIRIVLGSEGKPTSNEDVKAYQQFNLGRFGGETCLLELMPLPSPDAGTWNFKDWSNLPDLASRRAYLERYAPSRARKLWYKVREHKPPVVVFYSLTYLGWWKDISGVTLTDNHIAGVKSFSGRNGHTVFIVVPQPAHRVKGKGNDYYIEVGRTISTLLAIPSVQIS